MSLTTQEIAELHWKRGGKFVMGSGTLLEVGSIVDVLWDSFRQGKVEHPFRVTAKATYKDALDNRPLENLEKSFEGGLWAFYYFIEPCD